MIKIRSTLLAGAAAAALLAGSPQSKAFMYTSAPGWYTSLEGRYMWNAGDKVPNYIYDYNFFSSSYSGASAKAKDGWGGAIMVGYRFQNRWDIAVGGQAGFLKGKDKASFSNGTTFANEREKVKLDYYVLDFEAGYNMPMSAGSSMRLFGGVRGAYFKEKAKGFVSGSNGSPTFFYSNGGKRKTTYWGVGPRIGVDAKLGISGGLHVFGGVAGAVLIGKFKDKTQFCGTYTGGPFCYNYNDKNKTKLVPNLEGELGLGYSFNTGNGTFSLQAGYRGDAWWGAGTQSEIIAYRGGSSVFNYKDGDHILHGPFVRLAMNFGAAPAPIAAAPPPPPPAAVMAKNYIVFFDFDRSDLTAQSRATIKQAADASKTAGTQRLTVTGHADRSGPDAYNMALSLRRANAVKDELVRDGVPASGIVIVGRGETQPLVPTADGVKEPQNRRVEIVLN